jgi:AraC family transcriptional regulator of adaptative response / methylphosphotriester-DNA alkyltransferase methyltransferase
MEAELAPATFYCPPVGRGATRRRVIFEEAVAAIEDGYHDDGLTVANLARCIFTSTRQLQRAFTEAGTSFQACLLAVRMERAAELLLETSLPVARVAALVGYRQPSQFAKAFRRYHRQAPTRLRTNGRPAAPPPTPLRSVSRTLNRAA